MRRSSYFLSEPQRNIKTDSGKNKEEFILPLTITRRILSLMGVLPCSRESPYWPNLDRKIGNVFYCGVILTIMTWNALWTVVQKKIQHDEIDPSQFMKRIITLETTILMLPHIILYLMWVDVPEMRHCINLFINLQDNFRRTTGKSFEDRKLMFEKLCSYSSLIVLPSFYYLMTYLIPYVDKAPYVFMAVMYGNMAGFFVVIYWNITAMNMVDILEDIEFEFKKCLQTDGLTANVVFEFRLLWLSVRAVCDSMGKWHAPSFGYSTCMSLSIVMFYQGLTLFQGKEFAAALGHIATGSIYAIIIYLSCRASHGVQEKMKCLVKEILPNISLSSYDRGIQKEIVMLYLVESARPAVMTFRGLLIINRHLLLSFFSNVSTYIIVLVQFLHKNNYMV